LNHYKVTIKLQVDRLHLKMSKILMLLKVTCGGPLIYMHKNRGKKRKMGLIGLIY